MSCMSAWVGCDSFQRSIMSDNIHRCCQCLNSSVSGLTSLSTRIQVFMLLTMEVDITTGTTTPFTCYARGSQYAARWCVFLSSRLYYLQWNENHRLTCWNLCLKYGSVTRTTIKDFFLLDDNTLRLSVKNLGRSVAQFHTVIILGATYLRACATSH
jgi:hypothetical protein